MKHIGFFRTDRLGDVLVNLPALAALRARWPAARITLLTRPELVPLLTSAPDVNQVIGWQPKAQVWWRQAWELARLFKQHTFDVTVISNPLKAAHAAAWLARVPIRVGYAQKGGRWFLTHAGPVPQPGAEHETLRHVRLIAQLYPEARPLFHPLRIEPLWRRRLASRLAAAGILAGQRPLIIHPWASVPQKCWALDRFVALSQEIYRSWEVPVIWIGETQQRAKAEQALPAHPGLLNWVGQLALPETAALLQTGSCLISNDSGPVHLACAVQGACIVLCGGQDPATSAGRWGPWGPADAQVVWKPDLQDITIPEVREMVKRFIHVHTTA